MARIATIRDAEEVARRLAVGLADDEQRKKRLSPEERDLVYLAYRQEPASIALAIRTGVSMFALGEGDAIIAMSLDHDEQHADLSWWVSFIWGSSDAFLPMVAALKKELLAREDGRWIVYNPNAPRMTVISAAAIRKNVSEPLNVYTRPDGRVETNAYRHELERPSIQARLEGSQDVGRQV